MTEPSELAKNIVASVLGKSVDDINCDFPFGNIDGNVTGINNIERNEPQDVIPDIDYVIESPDVLTPPSQSRYEESPTSIADSEGIEAAAYIPPELPPTSDAVAYVIDTLSDTSTFVKLIRVLFGTIVVGFLLTVLTLGVTIGLYAQFISRPQESESNPASSPSSVTSHIPAPVPVPVALPTPVGETCFDNGDELRSAVKIYLQGDVNGTVKSTYGDVESWCVEKVTDFSYLFCASYDMCGELYNPLASKFNENLSRWDTRSAVNMARMFAGASAFNQDLGQWNISSVTIMSWMFYKATSFNQDLSSWDVSSTIWMEGLFSYATSFNQVLWQWNVSSVKDMSWMFENAVSFDQYLGSWDVSSTTKMTGMFSHATSFNQVLKWWNVSSVTDMSWMFHGACSFNQDLGSWNVSVDSFSCQ